MKIEIEWHTINSAPKTRLLGYDADRHLIYTMHWGNMSRLPRQGWIAEGPELSRFEPTHWTVIPTLDDESKAIFKRKSR